MKKHIKVITLLMTLAMIASCNSNPSAGGDNSSGGPGTSDSGSSTPTPVDDYKIILPTSSSYSISSDKQRAKKNEIVTITITMAGESYSLVSIKLNDTTDLDPVEGVTGQYRFVMPNRDARINVKISVTGDVTLQGDIAVPLQEENGIYVARGVEVLTDSFVKYVVGNEDLRFIDLDEKLCFANVTYDKGSVGFKIAGNAKYNFFYNPSATYPCYVQRTEVTTLPNDVSTLYSLFSGAVRTTSTINPQNMLGVEYANLKDNVAYEWNLYTGNTSIGNAKRYNNNGDLGTVYKHYDDDLYTLVDSYVQKDELGKTFFNEDRSKVSYRKDVATTTDSLKSQITPEDAKFALISPDHNLVSLEYAMYSAYRSGFDSEWNEFLKQGNVKVTSTKNSDGSFKTVVDSFKTLDYSNDSTSTVTPKKQHIEFDIVIDFNKDGSVDKYAYKENLFGEDAYDFSNLTWLTGGENNGTLTQQIDATFTYGTPTASAPAFDESPYFITSIDEANITNPKATATGTNAVCQGDIINTYLDVSSYLPTTALDFAQYTVRGVKSGTSIAQESANSSRYVAKTTGSSTVVINNGTANTGISIDLAVNVINNIQIRYFYLVDGWYAPDGAAIKDTRHADVIAGHVTRFGIKTSPDNGSFDDLTFKITNGSGQVDTSIIASVTHELVGSIHYIDVDAVAARITTATVVTVLPQSPSLENNGSGQDPFEFTVYPNTELDSIVGRFKSSEVGYTSDVITFTDTDSTQVSGYKVGTIVSPDGSKNVTYTFAYKYENSKITINSSRIKADDEDSQYFYSYTLKMSFNVEGALEVYFGYERTIDMSDIEAYDVIGTDNSDDDYGGDYIYIEFAKIS